MPPTCIIISSGNSRNIEIMVRAQGTQYGQPNKKDGHPCGRPFKGMEIIRISLTGSRLIQKMEVQKK